jgi:hypothetical protein
MPKNLRQFRLFLLAGGFKDSAKSSQIPSFANSRPTWLELNYEFKTLKRTSDLEE